ncbi:MAG: type IV secretion system DNA-binding domain-containing protein [Thermoanaerobaculia bacterium]|nr:type IV secretion system DNA-binding domain-containing protein [Thermoanaerobaculia bacterium]
MRAEELLVLGETRFRKLRHRFGLLESDRLRHVWVIGKTGSGKSTLLANLIASDLARGNGLGVLDPHGDLITSVLPYVPRSRTNGVLLFAPGDREFPVSWNIFRTSRGTDRSLLASEIVSVFKKHWSASWGPRLEHVLRNGILALSEREDATLLLLYRFITDKALREKLVPKIRDPVVKSFWTDEFAGYSKTLEAEALAPIQNKLGAFLSQPLVRNIVGQERSRVDLASIMEKRGVLFANLATSAIGEDASALMGSLLVSSALLAASHRPRGGPPFILYVDEFQRFTTDSIATILSEARKYGLGLVLAHQYLFQLPETIRSAILGNVGTKIVFRVGNEDAELLEPVFGPAFQSQDLASLRRYEMIIRLLARGEELAPMSATSLPPRAVLRDPAEAEDTITRVSRSRFAKPREDVESAIRSEFGA